jgi:RNA polymerase subunit RPABC4/transcription elongation factor Spt4
MTVILPFVCPICGFKSYNSTDATERYCGRCHRFVDEKLPPLPEQPAIDPSPAHDRR